MFRTLLRLLAAVLCAVQLGACASVMSGTSQSIFVETPMADGASCKLSDSKKGSWYLPTTPGPVTVQKGDGPMNILCEKSGYISGLSTVAEELDGATMGNILIGGVVGFVADAASGAAQKYPDKVAVWLRPTEWVSPDAEVAWNRVKAEYEEAARLEQEKKAGHTASIDPPKPAAPPPPQVIYQPMYLNEDGTLSPAPAPQSGQQGVVYMAPPGRTPAQGQSAVIAPLAPGQAAVQNAPTAKPPQVFVGREAALAAFEKTGQKDFSGKKSESGDKPSPAMTDSDGGGDGAVSAAMQVSSEAPAFVVQETPTPPTVYMMPIVVQTPPPPPPPLQRPYDCVPGNRPHMMGTGCR